jgi:uncharacterized membrane protein YphA (DoxX/SURF4 family)
MTAFLTRMRDALDATRKLDFLGPLALRLYLVPVFWVAGTNKLAGPGEPGIVSPNVIAWFGNPDWGLGLPFPTLMCFLAVGAEIFGSISLLLGLGTRWMSIPLMITMLVAALRVHWDNGWQAVADAASPFAGDDIEGATERLDMARRLLREHGNYDWLTESGNFVISNNGMEWAVTYFVMILALFFSGAGKASLDHLIAARLRKSRL